MGGNNNHDDGHGSSKHGSASGGSGGGWGNGDNSNDNSGGGPGWRIEHSDRSPNRQVTWLRDDEPQFKLTTGPATLDGSGRNFSSWEVIRDGEKNGPKQTFLEHNYMPLDNYGHAISGAQLSGKQPKPVRGGFHDAFKKLSGSDE